MPPCVLQMPAATTNVDGSADFDQAGLEISQGATGELQSNGDYKGFVAGVASGVTKLTGMSDHVESSSNRLTMT